MALKSESPSPPNEVVDIVPIKSAPEPDEDLEDGEIFDDDDDDVPVPPPKPAEPAAPQKEGIATIVLQMQQMQQQMGLVGPGGGGMGKRRGSPMDRGRSRANRLKRPKRPRDDDRPFISKKRRRSDDEKPNKEAGTEDEEDDLGRESPSNMRDWFRSDDEDEELGFNDGPGGRGGNRRGRRDFGRSRRGGRSGRGGGRRGPNNRRDGGLCKFFLQGNCQRGDDCPYSHTIYPRKYELCRFYMNDCCVKKDKCNYMHEDFPCKFWHMGLKCYAGRRCKFSHQKVTPYIKQMLLKHNQVESDKHFIQHLKSLGDSRSPTPPDYSDYEAPSGNSNYVIVGRKRGSNKDDITVDDIDLLDSDHDDRQERHDRDDRTERPEREDREAPPKAEKGVRGHRHRSERSSRHSRDDDHKDQDDHRDRGHKSQDDRRDRSHKDQDDRGHKDHRSDRNDRNSFKADRDSARSSHHNRDRERDTNPSYEERRSDEEDGRTPMPSPSQQSNDSRDIEAAEGRDVRAHTPPLNKDKSSRQKDKERERDKDMRRKDRDTRQKDHKSKKGRSRTKSRSRSRSQSRTRSRTRTPSPPPPRDRDSNHTSNKAPLQEVVETSAPSEIPPNLPKKQMELYLRIQQQQREAGNIEDEDDAKEKEDEDKDDWYSSDEDGGDKSGPLATILNKLKSQPKPTAQELPTVPNVSAIPDFDISAVSKLLSSVRETIEQKKNTSQPPLSSPRKEAPKPEENKPDSPIYEDKRRRDPRLMMRGDSTPPSLSPTHQPMKLPPLDIDLRVPSSSAPLTADVDLRQLPFKPVPMHQAAKEIDASTTANPPIPWVLTKFTNPPKPDYSHVHPKNPIDPRLKKYQTGSGMLPLPPQMNKGGGGFVLPQYNQVMQQVPMQPMGGLPGAPQPPAARDPRQRSFATNDPRRKPSSGPPAQQAMPVGPFPNQMGFPPGRGIPMPPPGMPMYPGRQDSDLRNPNPFLPNDIDFRFQQPASHPHYP